MRSAGIGFLLFVLAVLSMPIVARAQAPDCPATASDLSETIECNRKAYRSQLENCQKAPTTGWSAPIEGQRVLSFGEKTGYGASSKGIVYETERTARAKAPVAGLVIYADEFRSYGKLVILDVCGFDVLLAGLETISVRSGDLVQASSELGRMTSRVGQDLPVLYLEVRNAGRPIDPDPFLK
jgi:septal ring factor EnvC (AmiA/AmiB activator)